MRPATAAALVGAGALSTLAGPLHGLHLRRNAATQPEVIAREVDAPLEQPVRG
jgi:citrate synthase